MAFFGRKDNAAAKKQPSAVDLIKEETAQQFAVAELKELVENMSKSCFNICFPQFGSSMSNSERECTLNCAKKFIQAWNTTSTVYVTRLKEAQPK